HNVIVRWWPILFRKARVRRLHLKQALTRTPPRGTPRPCPPEAWTLPGHTSTAHQKRPQTPCQPHLCVVFAMNPYSSLQSRSVRAIASCSGTSRSPVVQLNRSALTTASSPAIDSWTGTPELTSCRSLYLAFVLLTLGESMMIC